MTRWLYPTQAEPPTTKDAKFILETYQIAAVKLDTNSSYDGDTSTTSFLAANGITVGVWDAAFIDLLKRMCPWTDGTGIGPREAERLRPSHAATVDGAYALVGHQHTYSGVTK